MTSSELSVSPSPVDWRLWHLDVQMGWKTSAEIDAVIKTELRTIEMAHGDGFAVAPFSLARRYLGLAKIPGLVETLGDELEADKEKKVVLFFETRDVGMALRDVLKAYSPVLLFKGTPDAQKAKRLKQFQERWQNRVAVVQLQAAPLRLPGTGYFVELSADQQTNVEGLKSLVPDRRHDVVTLKGTVDVVLMRQRWQATEALLKGVPV